jgi:hypothetical protein
MAQKEHVIQTAPTRARSLLALWGVLIVCAAPIIAAFVVYFFFKPAGNSSAGELVLPQRPVVPIGATTLEGEPFEFSQRKGQWFMVIAAPSACDEKCRAQLYHMRQIRISTGKNRERVERVWLVTDDAPIDIPLLKEHEGLIVARVAPQRLVPWLTPDTAQLAGRMWFVDMRGNLMMQYAPDADPKGIRKDLGKLLYVNKV